jgi:hypothetical protein
MQSVPITNDGVSSNLDQRSWQHRRRKTKQKHNTIFIGYNNTQTNTNNVNKTCALLQTTGVKDEPNIVIMRKLQRTPHNGTATKKLKR